MQFKEWGEDKWVHYLKEQFSSKSPLVGIGDDCAVVPYDQNRAWLITTDALVEGIHFLKEQIPASELGYKTIAVNVSDIAAMGGLPHYAFLTIALPKHLECQWARDLLQGIKTACEKWDVQLLGGDTVGSKRDLFINVTLIGSAEIDKIKYRHGAKMDDIVCLTGYLGNSGAGLKALQDGIPQTENSDYLILSHIHPEPHLQQGLWLASQSNIHAMMDVSDGLDCDLKRLLRSSQCGAILETSRLPLSEALLQTCSEHGWDPLKLALTGGEDYCLLVTISPESFPHVQDAFREKFNTPLYEIGKITDQSDKIEYLANGTSQVINYATFDHFD